MDQTQDTPATDADQTGHAEPEATAEQADLDEQAATVEAILFVSDNPLSAARIAQTGELGGPKTVREAVERLNERYERMGCAFRVETLAGGYQMLTVPEYNDVLRRLVRARSDSRLSQAALETLAIVAYRQPILRADIEAIRGVACGEVLRGLLEKNLAKIVGRADVLGRPMLYGTTKRFLEVFGLNSLDDLPRVEELRVPPAPPETQEKSDEAGEGAETEAKPPADGQDAPLADEAPAGDGPAGEDEDADANSASGRAGGDVEEGLRAPDDDKSADGASQDVDPTNAGDDSDEN